MKFDRLRVPALTAAAVLLISGAGGAIAASPTGVASVRAAVTTVSEPVEAVDTDNIQQGDQTTPDGVGVEATSASTLRAARAKVTVKAAPKTTVKAATTAKAAAPVEAPDEATGETGAEPTATETGPSDGAGGHEDPAGDPNADHQFNGEE